MVSIKLIPSLALMAATVSAIPTNDTFAIQDGTVPNCSDLLFLDDNTFHEVNCTILPENLANFQFALPQFDIDTEEENTENITSTSLDTLVRRAKKKNNNPSPPIYPLVPESGRLLWQEASDFTSNSSTFKQCINNGPVPSIADVKSLCSRVDSNYVIRRAGQPIPSTNKKDKNKSEDTQAGPCVCKVWSYKSAVFSVCNCDQCDALIIPYGLRDKCREISQHCTTQGYSSGYIKMPDSGAVYEQHMAGKGEKADAKLTMGDLGESMSLSCRSGDTGKNEQAVTGSFIKCKKSSRRHAKECWRVTDPQNIWYVKDK
ncbi:hypothetical protein VTL71DRAFT_8003 [Oculimacula yallundae]|uniref:Cyanovirin-N domain-containing protein n=1 Tax=Oculimacula yallundae TaxID=86028 RepID=A0ABR4CWB4_9HELO